MSTRRQMILGSVAAIAAATVAIPAKAAGRFEPFELRFYVNGAVDYSNFVWRATLITVPFDEDGETALDVSDFDKAMRQHIILAILARIPEQYSIIINEDDGILFCKLHKRYPIGTWI